MMTDCAWLFLRPMLLLGLQISARLRGVRVCLHVAST